MRQSPAVYILLHDRGHIAFSERVFPFGKARFLLSHINFEYFLLDEFFRKRLHPQLR